MRSETILRISMLALAVYTSLMLMVAETSLFPYALTFPVALLVLWISGSRKWQWLQFGPLLAFVLGLAAFAFAFTELMAGSLSYRLAAGAHLLVYLTWTVMVMRKGTTEYWWLVALCVMQAAIGAVFDDSLLFGSLLFGFLLLALWALAILSLCRAQRPFLSATESETGLPPTEGGKEETGPAARKKGRRKAGTSAEKAVPSSLSAEMLPLLLSAGEAAGTIQFGRQQRWLSLRFFSGIVGLTAGSIVVAFLFFLLIPRYWVGRQAWGARLKDAGGTTSLAGFTENVSLGDFGTILESSETVFEVRLFDEQNRPLSVETYAGRLGQAEPYFRGNTLDIYRDGQWSTSRSTTFFGRELRRRPARPAVRQEYRLRPLQSYYLFAMRSYPLRPVRAAAIDERHGPVIQDVSELVLLRGDNTPARGDLRYTVFTRSRPDQIGRRFFPLQATKSEIPDGRLRRQLTEFLQREVKLPPRKILPTHQFRDMQRFRRQERERAEKIVQFLRDSGRYTYTLRIPPRRAPDVDPVMEFLVDRRSGHCEYFATALALLLRADGIPSRLVGGFKGGGKNALTGFFEVQQRHAHAWVEAYLGGEWILLDATPAESRNLAVEQAGNQWSVWHNLSRFVKYLWLGYVASLELPEQQRRFFTPLNNTARDAWNALRRERKGTAAGWQALKEFLTHPGRWFSWQGALISLCLMILLLSLVWIVKWLHGLFRTLRPLVSAGRHSAPLVPFYERFRRLCERAGLVRSPQQTQREFAEEVGRTLHDQLAAQRADTLPGELAQAFYDVRFGRAELPPQRRQEIERFLQRLEESLHRPQ